MEQLLQSLHAHQQCFTDAVPAGSGWKGLLRRLGRKLTFWYIKPFGVQQNEYNAQTAELLSELLHMLKSLAEETGARTDRMSQKQEELEHSIGACSQLLDQVRLRSTLNGNQIDRILTQQEQLGLQISQTETALDDCMAVSAPDLRFQAMYPDCDCIPASAYVPLLAQQQAVRQAADSVQAAERIAQLEKSFAQLSDQAIGARRRDHYRIAVVCMGLRNSLGMEAIRNEAYDLFRRLEASCRYAVTLVSIEPEAKTLVREGNRHFIPTGDIASYLAQSRYKLCIVCESTVNILLTAQNALLLQPSLVRLSGQNPLRGVSESALRELRHLNDFGVHRYCVQSETAAKILTDAGFHEPLLLRPITTPDSTGIFEQIHLPDSQSFTVGFATAPMTAEQMEPRGISLLCETVQACPDYQFVVLWRNEGLPVPDVLQKAENCTLQFGRCDMEAFYRQIDCVLIPYQSMDWNHGCSLSAVEAMQRGIPVVATPISGVSELIAACGMGEVSDRPAEALRTVCSRYETYRTPDRRMRLQETLDLHMLIRQIEQMVDDTVPTGTVTLYEWDRRLKEAGRYLVQGREEMKAYYRQAEVAGQYHATRFTTYPQNCFDALERSSIRLILHRCFQGQTPQILDIACGDGRILQEDLKFGICTAMDSSAQMLKLVQERFSGEEQRLTCVEGDFFETLPDGKFDAVTTFRYLRHFSYAERKQLYARIGSMLRQGGILVFDLPNIRFELPNKTQNGWQKYNIYDVFQTQTQWLSELRHNGFLPRYVIPVGQGLCNVPGVSEHEPMTWTVAAVWNGIHSTDSTERK